MFETIENDICNSYLEVLNLLLKDHSSGKNIIWGTDNYSELGNGYRFNDHILLGNISGKNQDIIIPRSKKSKELQKSRVNENAEVFTPSWVCNLQNNLIDNVWFDRENVFNTGTPDENNVRKWKTNKDKIEFPSGKTWIDYVKENRLEITCGEAPYITSRYDTVTGDYIPIEERIGLLDRKLRIVRENTSTLKDWIEATQDAYKSIYGYEYQGDNLFLARKNILYAFVENYYYSFNELPDSEMLCCIADIISWNVWQMDGLKGVVPGSCHDAVSTDLFGDPISVSCTGCAKEDIAKHSGIYCLINDWSTGNKVKYIDLLY